MDRIVFHHFQDGQRHIPGCNIALKELLSALETQFHSIVGQVNNDSNFP